MFLEVEEGGQDQDGRSRKSLFNQIHNWFTTKAGTVYGIRD